MKCADSIVTERDRKILKRTGLMNNSTDSRSIATATHQGKGLTMTRANSVFRTAAILAVLLALQTFGQATVTWCFSDCADYS